MRFAVVYSKKDTAGINIVEAVRKLGFMPHVPFIDLKKDTICSDNLEKHPWIKNMDFVVFASKHKSEKGNPSLSLHAPGNWRGADFGGKQGKVAPTSAFVLKYLFQRLNENHKNSGIKNYDVTLEVTHHGPSIDKPCCFIELGSSEKQWQDKEAAKIVAETIMDLQNYNPGSWIPCLGVGGPHYCPSFNKIQLSSEYAVSHIIPQYALPLTEAILKEAEEKTQEHLKCILLDWKGCGKSEEREKYLEIIKRFGIPVKRTSEIEK
jgi:D-aminoacyl-tRNA deacylase